MTHCIEGKQNKSASPGLRWFWVVSLVYQFVLLAALLWIGLYTSNLTQQVKILRHRATSSKTVKLASNHPRNKVHVEDNHLNSHPINGISKQQRREVIAGGKHYYGPQGPPGADGRDGTPGPQGMPGKPGPRSPNYDKIQAYIDDILQKSVIKDGAKLGNTVSAIPPVNGASYIRWGRIDCPNPQSKLIYSGRIGGSYYSAGGAYNPQCFPDNPKYLITRAPALVKVSGGEYEIQGRVLGDLYQENIPCAVCQAYKGRMSLLMIPAQVKCPSGWTTEYVGYLLAGRKTNRRSEFICVDKDPQVLQGTGYNRDGELMFHTAINCNTFGSCPPYRDSDELACVVCTR